METGTVLFLTFSPTGSKRLKADSLLGLVVAEREEDLDLVTGTF